MTDRVNEGYILEVYSPGSTTDVWSRFTSQTPFLSIHAGDVLNRGLRPGSEAPEKMAVVTAVEHLVWQADGLVKHKLLVYTKEIDEVRQLMIRSGASTLHELLAQEAGAGSGPDPFAEQGRHERPGLPPTGTVDHQADLLAHIRRRAAEIPDEPGPNTDPLYRMVLQLGDPEPAIPRPRRVRRTSCTFCYRCAWHAMERYPELAYITVGFALRRADQARSSYGPDAWVGADRVVEGHGWVSDGEHAIEVTWPEPALAYYGIRFSRQTYATLLRRYGQWDVIRWLNYEVAGWWSPSVGWRMDRAS